MGKDKARVLERWTWILVFVLTLAGLGIIWTVFLTTTLGEREKSAIRETEDLQREARIFSSGLGRMIDDSRLALEVLVNQVEFHRDRNPLGDPGIISLIQFFHSRNKNIGDLRLADRSGRLHLFESAAPSSFTVADRDYFRVQNPYPGHGFFIDRPILSRLTQRWTLILSEPLAPNPGDLTVALASVDFRRLDTLVGSLTQSRGDVIRVFRDDGALLYEYPLPTGFPQDGKSSQAAAILASENSTALVKGDRLTAFHRVDNLPLWVAMERPPTSLGGASEWWPWQQLLWVGLLTLVILASAIGLVRLLGSLRSIRLAQAELARIDPLTGLINRRAFLERCTQERSRVERNPGPLSLALLDLDRFKEVNDKFGHPAGDQALREFAKALVRTMRSTDALARTGGEEFAILMPQTDGKSAMEIAERIRAEVATITLPKGRLTTSIGVAVSDGVETFESWYRRADQALYRAKNGGRNRVEAALPPGS